MSRLPAFAIVAAALAFSLTASGPASAQVASAGLWPVSFDDGTSTRDWRTPLTRGAKLPNHERLVVVAEDGRVVRVVDGEDTRVNLPLDLHTALADGTLRATLVHNHLADQGFSCADFRQLAKVGVTGVVVVGNQGTVFETAAGPRYDARVFEEAGCRELLGAVASQLAAEVGYRFGDRSELADQVPHLLASALERVGVIEYRSTPAVLTTVALARHHLEFERVISRVTKEMTRRVSARLRVPTDN